ncbi:MAG: response regulator, partial [Bacteriovoracaceae bacterium]|nr:response regulator [Bacteriovoracaceae bacterium]
IAINKAFKKLFNFTDEQVLGKTNHELLPFEVAEQFRKNDLEIVTRKNVIESEEKAFDDEGKEHIYHSFKFPYFDKDGNVIATGGISLDITEKKEFERQAFHNSKLASIGELAAGVGHEINNPLTIIKGYIGSIQYKMDSDETFDKDSCHKYLEKIDSATNRIAKIVQGLRNFSRMDSEEFKDFELSEAITESAEMVKDIYYKEGINVFLDSSSILGVHVFGSMGKLQQVFMNLLSNARDATAGNEVRSIHINSSVRHKKAYISVKDNGTGISKHVQTKIFDPFFTTKEVNQGTGIGLSIAHNIIEEHGGSLTCESVEGEGATFSIELPISYKEVEKPKDESTPHRTNRNSLNIRAILADDEEAIRQILTEMLEGLGVSVTPVGNGREALEVYMDDPGYDMIISDIKMPVMDGTALLKEIRKKTDLKQPKMVMVTGGINIDFEDPSSEYGKLIDGYLLKPFDEDAVYDVIRAAMAKNS